MGQLTNRKRVILPVYRPTDHTPSVYKDPYSDRVIPVGYFLNNLDEIGPLHWENSQTADYTLKVVRCEEINLWCDYFDQYFHQSFSRNLLTCRNYAQQQQSIPSKSSTLIHNKCHKDANALDAAVLTNCVNYMIYNYNRLLFNHHYQYVGNHRIEQTSSLPSPPGSPTSPNYDHHTNSDANALNNKPTITDSSRPTPYYFFTHTLVLASQSGFFNQLFGPINNPASSLCTLHRQQTPPSPTSPTSPQFCSHPQLPTQLTVPIPHPDCFEVILHWLYHHDDDAWLDVITPENFPKFYENVKFLKLGKEAFDILDSYIAEAEEDGFEITGEGIVEVY